MQGIGDAQKHVEHLSLHPYLTAVIQLKLSHCFLFNRYDSLHVLDGGMTSRIIVLVGNWLYYCSEGFRADDGKVNEKWEQKQAPGGAGARGRLHTLHTAASGHGHEQEGGPAREARLQLAVHGVRAARAADRVRCVHGSVCIWTRRHVLLF